ALVTWAADPPDTLTLTDGEMLIGKLVKSTGKTVTFHSDGVGDVTVDWSKVKELKSSGKFAVIPKGVTLKRKEADGKIPVGTISEADQKIQVSPGGAAGGQTVATGDTAYVVDQKAYERALHNPNFLSDWKGGVTGGVSLIEATQNSQTFTVGV